MRKTALPLVVLALLLTAIGPVADAKDKLTLTGDYVWNSGQPSALKAIFTATGENRWDVAFHFRFRGNAEVFSGTATGSLTGGMLAGKVKNRRGRGPRAFTFEGKFKDGTFRGKHAEMHGSRESPTGTLTLHRKGQPGTEVL